MWTCEKCGRSFEKNHQDHFCGAKPTTIDEYISLQPEAVQPLLRQVRETLQKTLPDAEEHISWAMPTFWQKRNLIHFAAFKSHIGIYPGAAAMEHFAPALTAYKTSKGAVQLPLSKPLPLELVAEIAAWCAEAAGE